MAIKFYTDRIQIGDFALSEGQSGIQFTGKARANKFLTAAFQGTVAGFSTGGSDSPSTASNVIDRFPFSTDTNASDWGDLTQARSVTTGLSSPSYGFSAGGDLIAPGAGWSNVIDKYPFSTSTNASDVGNLGGDSQSFASASSELNGYVMGGSRLPPGAAIGNIEKFPFQSNTNITNIGSLTVARTQNCGQSSATDGYSSGGNPYPSPSNVIDKFPFATDVNAVDSGDLIYPIIVAAGQSSETHGYISGGYSPTSYRDYIQKFNFSANSNSSDVGDLTVARYSPSGQSSTTHGYTSGANNGPAFGNTIDKFPFSTDSNATDVGDLTQSRYGLGGAQD